MSCCSVIDDVKADGLETDGPNTNLTNEKDELFCGPQKHDKDCVTGDTHDDVASENSVDSGSAGGLDESGSSIAHTAQTHCSNEQKSKRPNSPGPHLVKTTCGAAHSPNPKLTLCLSSSPGKGISTPSDVEMLSPDSPVCKTLPVNNSADRDRDGSACVEDCAKTQVKEAQQFVKDSDSGVSDKERVNMTAMGTEDTEMAECSGSSDMSQNLIGGHSGVTSERYLNIFISLCKFFFFQYGFLNKFVLAPLCTHCPPVIL